MNVMGEFSLGSAICEMVAQGKAVSLLDALSARGTGYEKVATKRFRPEIDFEPKLLFPVGIPRSKPMMAFAKAVRSRLEDIRDALG